MFDNEDGMLPGSRKRGLGASVAARAVVNRDWMRSHNLKLMADGAKHRWTIVDGRSQMVEIAHLGNTEPLTNGRWTRPQWHPSKHWRCDGQGGVDYAVWNPKLRQREWRCNGDATVTKAGD